jgi:hypothetical protein
VGASVTNSALTRWLKQGLARGMCPLCRVAHKADREYLWHFFEDYAGTDAGVEALRASRGFCGEHGRALRALEVEGLGSTLGICEIFEEAFAGIVAELERLDVDGSAEPAAPCPACANRERELTENARHLVELLRTDQRSRERYHGSLGICLPHFPLVWGVAGAERRLLLEVQCSVARDVLVDLKEHIRKQGAEARDEPAGPEADSWERALLLTGGWPPPKDPIGRPETATAGRAAER